MTDEVRSILTDAGMDVESALMRFMNNEGMLEKFLKKFKNDPSYKELIEACERKDVEAGFKAAHTLKGVAANFSFETLRAAVSDQTEEFRAGNLEPGVTLMDKVTTEYEKVVAAITKIYGDE